MESAEIEDYPQYRIRLFFSVDLVGSTAFKAGDGKRPADGKASQPIWVEATRKFYSNFPGLIERKFDFQNHSYLNGMHPRVWKTVGDEILFCCRLIDTEHLVLAMRAFQASLKDYGQRLREDAKSSKYDGLDVKGAAWIAAFPDPNVTVALNVDNLATDQFGELFEANADRNPHSVDFLGNGIDTGFRVASRSTSSQCALSVDLAYLLSSSGTLPRFEFCHYERVALKGVLRGQPYPIFCLQTERSASRRDLNEHEQTMLGTSVLQNSRITTFLDHFMKEENIEFPVLSSPGVKTTPPASYLDFRERWLQDAVTEKQRRELELSGEDPSNSDGEEIPTVVTDFAADKATFQFKSDEAGEDSSR